MVNNLTTADAQIARLYNNGKFLRFHKTMQIPAIYAIILNVTRYRTSCDSGFPYRATINVC